MPPSKGTNFCKAGTRQGETRMVGGLGRPGLLGERLYAPKETEDRREYRREEMRMVEAVVVLWCAGVLAFIS